MNQFSNFIPELLSVDQAGEPIASPISPVQAKELSTLKKIIKVLETNGLHYCAIGGTCLGVVRHKGFIPWEDDIAIALPRKEYELFRTKMYKSLPEHNRKVDCDTSSSHGFWFIKIHDSTTTQIEQYAINSPDRITGAFVEVYLLDGWSDDLYSKKKFTLATRNIKLGKR